MKGSFLFLTLNPLLALLVVAFVGTGAVLAVLRAIALTEAYALYYPAL